MHADIGGEILAEHSIANVNEHASSDRLEDTYRNVVARCRPKGGVGLDKPDAYCDADWRRDGK
jgi:hypothetical protein